LVYCGANRVPDSVEISSEIRWWVLRELCKSWLQRVGSALLNPADKVNSGKFQRESVAMADDQPDKSDLLIKPERRAPEAVVVDGQTVPVAPYLARPAVAPAQPIVAPPVPWTTDNSFDNNIEAKKLVVGWGTSVSGEISSCNTLIVEGIIEASLRGARSVVISETGVFKGSATIDEAELRGRFEGDLVVRNRLRIHATGNVSGTVTYKDIEIEPGGRISGKIQAPS